MPPVGLASYPLFAVHIADSILSPSWLLGGFALAVVLAFLGARRLRDEEIPQVALLTAAFFVASLAHVRVGPTSVHLLLNGLVGVVLGFRAALAIPVGLFLQAALLQHGGFTTLGVNSCVLVLPALLAWQLFSRLQRFPQLQQPWCRALLVATCTLLWLLSLLFSVSLLVTNRVTHLDALDTSTATWLTFHPLTLAAAAALALAAALAEMRRGISWEFPLGLFVGEVAVLATLFLNCLVLLWGGAEDWHTLALLVFVAHLPIAVVEGVVLGFAISFLARVKPEMIGWTAMDQPLAPSPAKAPAAGD